MESNRGGALAGVHETDEQVSENVVVLLRRRRMTQSALGTAVGISPQTMSRRIAGIQPWQWWEVVAIARFFDVTLEELSGELPSRDVYLVRHQGLEPRTRCLETNPKTRADLRVVA